MSPLKSDAPIATQCSWCRRWRAGDGWIDLAPAKPYKVSHGMCERCADAFDATLDNLGEGDDPGEEKDIFSEKKA